MVNKVKKILLACLGVLLFAFLAFFVRDAGRTPVTDDASEAVDIQSDAPYFSVESDFDDTTANPVSRETADSADTAAADTTAADTTAEEATDAVTDPYSWESVIFEGDGYQIIEGGSTLLGPPDTARPKDDTTAAEDTEKPWETEPFDPSEKVYYPTVLMYHCVHDEPYTENTALFVRPSELEEQLKLLSELEIDCLFADEFGPKEKNSVILTFDDGYEDNYTQMFPLIKKYNVKVTVYMIAYKIGMPNYLTREQIREMSDSGLVQFGSHTLDHPSLTSLDADGVREQFQGSNWLISEITGKPVTTVAYPSGRYNEMIMDVAREYYSFAYTTDDHIYYGQDPMMLPRYAILRDQSIYGFRRFVE